MSDHFSSGHDEDVEYGRPDTPYHIIQILLNTGGTDRLPGVNLRRIEMLRRRSSPMMEDDSSNTSGGGGSGGRNIITVQVAAASHSSGNPDYQNSSTRHRENSNLVNRRPTPRLNRQTTLALLTLDEDNMRIQHRNLQKRKSSDDFYEAPPPYTPVANETWASNHYDVENPRRHHSDSNQGVLTDMESDPFGTDATPSGDTAGHEENSYRQQARYRQQQLSRQTSDSQVSEAANNDCFCWPWFLKNRPILRLFLVILFNGLVSMMCAAVYIELERPQQIVRMENKETLRRMLEASKRNLTFALRSSRYQDKQVVLDLFTNYSSKLLEFTNIPEEMEWEMLAASAFVTSVSSTTGYGDIVPVTFEGKLFTIAYALYGIPVFLWYVIKLGALFRVVSMRLFTNVVEFLKLTFSARAKYRNQLRNVFLAASRPVQVQPDLSEELQDEKRFHPSVIGSILIVFLSCVAGFISYMEGITYFDAIYACFITYSTIGFGDIDIYRISYRSNWFNLMIYGNCVHVIGYTLLSAWISSILDKCGVRKY